MSETTRLVGVLKQALRERHFTYAMVARGLGMSLANVKRMFASERITLDRIEAICRLAGMDLGDLFQLYEESRQRISQLTEDQERELVADRKLLFAAVCVRNHLGFEEILEHYRIDEPELIQSLAKLDRLKIIDLLPGNRVKLRVAENFRWIPGGPIERFYEQTIQREFLGGRFDGEENPRVFLSGLLSERSRAIVLHRLESLANEVHQLHRQDRDLPLSERKNIGILFAMREWEFTALGAYRKAQAGAGRPGKR